MSYETKDCTGSLFINVEKRSENFPDYSGSMRIDNHDWWISGWKKQSKDGKVYLSLAFKRKDGTSDRPASTTAAPARTELDDLPF